MIAAMRGQTYKGTVKEHLLIRPFGARVGVMSAKEQYTAYKVTSLSPRFQEATRILTRYSNSSKKQDQLLNREALAPGKILAGKSDAEFIRERTDSMYRAQANIIREAHDDYWSAVRGGMTEREAIAALDAGNVSQDRIRQIVTGVFIPRPPSVTVLHTARQRGGQERYNAILDGYRNAVRKYHPNIEEGMKRYGELRAKYTRRTP